jgi:hypothetical protein
MMGTIAIKSASAVRDAVDRLEWRVVTATDFFGSRIDRAFVIHWEGAIAFYRHAVPKGADMGSQTAKLSLVARWTNRERSARLHTPTEATFEFVTEIPGEALDRIEHFRDGGRLHARLEGKLFVIQEERESKKTGHRPWIDDALRLMADYDRMPCVDLRSESFELTRDTWCTEILATLRPPGRFVVDVRVPIGQAHEDGAKRALDHIRDAQKTLDEGGRDGEVGRICYRALDELRKLVDGVEERYGKFGKERLIAQIKETKSLCDPERHGESPHHDDLKFDRPLAQHVLAVTSSIAGVVLR